MSPEELMRLAIAKAREGIAKGQSPIGCAIARDGKLLAVSHNVVLLTTDITAHGEITAIREACRAIGSIELTGAMVATTLECCPMCAAALHWARVDTIYQGATIADAQQAGFNELPIPAAELLRMGGSPVKVVPGILVEECRQLFGEWRAHPSSRAY